MFHLYVVSHVCASLIAKGARGTYLQACAARDTGRLTEWNIRICMDHGTGAAISQTKSVIGHEIAARTLTTAAEDTAVMIHEEILACRIHGEAFCVCRVNEVVETIAIPEVLQFAIPTHLTVRAVMVSF